MPLYRSVLTTCTPFSRNSGLNGVQVVRTDLYNGICSEFDLIIFNPPYLPTPEEERLKSWLNRAFDGGPTGRDEIARFLKGREKDISSRKPGADGDFFANGHRRD